MGVNKQTATTVAELTGASSISVGAGWWVHPGLGLILGGVLLIVGSVLSMRGPAQ